jgi:hypothetical protein
VNRKTTIIIFICFIALGVWFFFDYMSNANKTSYVQDNIPNVSDEEPIAENVYPIEYPAREIVRQKERIVASHTGDTFSSFTLSSIEPFNKTFEQGELTIGNFKAVFYGNVIVTGHPSFSGFSGGYEFVPDETSLELLPVSSYISVRNISIGNLYKALENANQYNKLLKVEISNYVYVSSPFDEAGASADIRILGE